MGVTGYALGMKLAASVLELQSTHPDATSPDQ
jgi:hypothetical protein